MFTLREAAKEFNIDLKKATVAIQGFGNAGCYAASLVRDLFGSKVVAVSDSKGGVYDPNGLDIEKACSIKAETSSVVNTPKAKKISNEELLELSVDILVPAALETVITKDNAKRIKAKIVAEGANGPTTPEADEVLFKKGVMVIPDILANAGGVTVSYFEWVQDLQFFFWNVDEIRERLRSIMVNAFGVVSALANAEKVDLRTAAYMLALGEVARALELRGIYP
jgi:glutamate dehydrogenase (NAD(P)+)